MRLVVYIVLEGGREVFGFYLSVVMGNCVDFNVVRVGRIVMGF